MTIVFMRIRSNKNLPQFVAKIGYEKSKLLNAVKTNLNTVFSAASTPDKDYTVTPLMVREPKLRAEALKGLGPANKDDYLCDVLFPPEHRRDGRFLFRCDCIVNVRISPKSNNS